jgi:hypothetical protein
MNYGQLVTGVEWIEVHWPTTGEKTWAGWEKIADEFFSFTAGAFMETAHNLFDAGRKYAPSPSEMKSEMRRVQALRIERGDDPVDRSCNGEHVWSAPWPTDEDRHLECTLCGATGEVFKCAHVINPRSRQCWYCPKVLVDDIETAVV